MKKPFVKLKNKKGFTLVETLVAVSILVIGTLGPITIAAQGIVSAGYAKDQITAYYLADEGIEFVRNVRDTNGLKGNPWLTYLDTCFVDPNVATDHGCYGPVNSLFNNDPSTILTGTRCPSSGCPTMIIDGNSGYYTYSYGPYSYTGTPTTFKRSIQILPALDGDPNERIVRVIMDWTSRGNARTFTVEENIYDSN